MSHRSLRMLAGGVFLIALLAACSSAGTTIGGPGWVGSAPRPRPASPANQPNIVFVLTDDLSWNLVKYMPHVLAMEHHGVTFRRYFVTDSLCCPSRTSIMTGELPHNDGVFGNTGSDGGFNAFLSHGDQTHTFATALQSRGYLTGMFGKFLNLYNPASSYAGQSPYVPPGWSAWAAADKHGYDEYGYRLAVGRRLASYGSDPQDYLTSVLSAKAGQFIKASATAHRPFLAEISTFAPHSPFVPAPVDASKFPGLQAPRSPAYGHPVVNSPRWLAKIPPLTPRNNAKASRAFQLRVQDVQSVDRMIGRLEAEVAHLGIGKNTYFVFSSDNGLHLGEHDLRQGKETAFDTDIRVPLVVTGPQVPPGTTNDQLTENIDLAPTFESLAGASAPSTVDGHSLVAQLHGGRPPGWRTAVLVEHHGPNLSKADPDHAGPNSGNPPSYEAIRTANATYVEYANGEREYYDLARDPFELDNQYASMPRALRTQLHDTLRRMESCHGSVSCWDAQHLVAPAAIR